CASTPDIQIPLRSAEECRLELAAAFPPGVDPDSVRDAQLDSALVRYREGRVEPEDTTRQLQRPPQLLDPRAVQRLMSVYYPPNLLSNGIGGRTDLMFYVGPDGVPEKFRIAETSGYREMDVASVQ